MARSFLDRDQRDQTVSGPVFDSASSNVVSFNRVLFEDNLADDGIDCHAEGGAVWFGLTGDDSTSFVDVTFSGNEAADGGAIYFADPGTASTHVEIADSLFIDNVASGDGTLPGLGGAVYAALTTLDAQRTTWTSNDADHGGGLYVDGAQFDAHKLKMIANDASARGGAIALTADAVVDVGHATFDGNTISGTPSAPGTGALADVDDATLRIINGVGMNNSNGATTGGGIAVANGGDLELRYVTMGGSSAYGVTVDALSSAHFQASILWGDGVGTVDFATGSTLTAQCVDFESGAPPGPGNVSLPPMFVDPGNNNFRLTSASPAAVSSSCPLGALDDLDNAPRTLGTSMGAYEYTP
jgi:hypothetical protein